MGLDYRAHSISALIGSKSGTTRTGATLTDYYDFDGDATKIIEVGGYSKLELSGVYTVGADETSNSIQIILEGSTDRTNWYRYLNEATSTSTSTLTQREFTIAQATTSGTLGYDAESTGFTVGFKVTGNGGATGYIEADTEIVAGTSGTLTLSNVTGAYVNDEALTDSGSGAATVNKLLVSTTTFTLPIDISSKYARISVKETGKAATHGNVFIEATLSGR